MPPMKAMKVNYFQSGSAHTKLPNNYFRFNVIASNLNLKYISNNSYFSHRIINGTSGLKNTGFNLIIVHSISAENWI